MAKKSARTKSKPKKTARKKEQEKVIKRIEKYAQRGFIFDSKILEQIAKMRRGEYNPTLKTLKERFSSKNLYQHAKLHTDFGETLKGSQTRKAGYSFTGKKKTPREIKRDLDETADRIQEEYYEHNDYEYTDNTDSTADYDEERGKLIYDRLYYYLDNEADLRNKPNVRELVKRAQNTIREELESVISLVGYSGLSKLLTDSDEQRFIEITTDLLYPSIDEAVVSQSLAEALNLLSVKLDFDEMAEIENAYDEI